MDKSGWQYLIVTSQLNITEDGSSRRHISLMWFSRNAHWTTMDLIKTLVLTTCLQMIQCKILFAECVQWWQEKTISQIWNVAIFMGQMTQFLWQMNGIESRWPWGNVKLKGYIVLVNSGYHNKVSETEWHKQWKPIFLKVLEAGRPGSGAPAWLNSGENSLPGLEMAAFWLGVYMPFLGACTWMLS